MFSLDFLWEILGSQAVNFLKISRIPASRNPRDRQLVAYQGRANEWLGNRSFSTDHHNDTIHIILYIYINIHMYMIVMDDMITSLLMITKY
jgi:hypothetical protein